MSHDKHELLPEVIVFAGPNGSGKSNEFWSLQEIEQLTHINTYFNE